MVLVQCTNTTYTDYAMMVAVPYSGFCQANAIFELKYDTISYYLAQGNRISQLSTQTEVESPVKKQIS